MKMTKPPTLQLLYECTPVTLYIDNANRAEIMTILDSLKWEKDKEYTVELKPLKSKKTTSQNAYAWSLMGQLAAKLKISVTDVYRQTQQGMSRYEIVPVKVEAVQAFTKAWEAGHIGRIVEDIGRSKIEGYRNLKVHYGISDYTKEEMSHFLELIIQECNEQGIQKLTHEEIKRLGVD